MVIWFLGKSTGCDIASYSPNVGIGTCDVLWPSCSKRFAPPGAQALCVEQLPVRPLLGLERLSHVIAPSGSPALVPTMIARPVGQVKGEKGIGDT